MEYLWVDGVPSSADSVAIPFNAPALQYGFGLFETMRLRRGRLLRWRHHAARLFRSAERLSLATTDHETLECEIRAALWSTGHIEGRVRLSLLAIQPSGQCSRILSLKPGSPDSSPVGTSTRETEYHPPAPSIRGMKTTNYLPDLLGIRSAVVDGDFDRIRTTEQMFIAEGHRSNIFIRTKGGIMTPEEGLGILPGVARLAILDQAILEGLSIKLQSLRLEEVNEECGIVMTNSLRGAIPVRYLFSRNSAVPLELTDSENLGRELSGLLDRESENSSLDISRE